MMVKKMRLDGIGRGGKEWNEQERSEMEWGATPVPCRVSATAKGGYVFYFYQSVIAPRVKDQRRQE
jgi:hypothetical protein